MKRLTICALLLVAFIAGEVSRDLQRGFWGEK